MNSKSDTDELCPFLDGELPETAKINETDTFAEGDEECNFEFDDNVDIDDI